MIFDCKFCSISLVTVYMLIYSSNIQKVDCKTRPTPMPGRKKMKIVTTTKAVEYEPIVLSPEERERWLRGEVDSAFDAGEVRTTVDWRLRKQLRLIPKKKLCGIIYPRNMRPSTNQTTKRYTFRQKTAYIIKDGGKTTTEKESKRAKKRKIVRNLSWVEESLRPYLLQLSTLPPELFTKMNVIVNRRNILPPISNVTGTVIFLHGEGIKAGSMKVWYLSTTPSRHAWNHIRLVFPTSPYQPYSLAERDLMYVWFDRDSLFANGTENTASIDRTAERLLKIISYELKGGIPMNRIVLGGYGMGGSMALHMAYRYLPHIAGVFAVGSFLNEESAVYTELAKNQSKRLPPMGFVHGALDDFVPMKWSRDTFKKLQSYGVPGDYRKVPDEGHPLDTLQTQLVIQWIQKILPDE